MTPGEKLKAAVGADSENRDQSEYLLKDRFLVAWANLRYENDTFYISSIEGNIEGKFGMGDIAHYEDRTVWLKYHAEIGPR